MTELHDHPLSWDNVIRTIDWTNHQMLSRGFGSRVWAEGHLRPDKNGSVDIYLEGRVVKTLLTKRQMSDWNMEYTQWLGQLEKNDQVQTALPL